MTALTVVLLVALAIHVVMWFGVWLVKYQVHTGATAPLPPVGDVAEPPKAASETELRWPRVAAFIPARNEEDAIEAAVRSLLDQDYPNLSVVVANDNSTDSTGEILARIANDYPAERLSVIAPPEPPAGWMGKCHAVWNAVKHAPDDAELFLFCDADVIHNPGTLRRAVHMMQTEAAGMVALLPRLDNKGFWEHAYMPATMHLGGIALDPRRVMDPDRPEILGIGAFSIVRRTVYESWGGHEAIKGEVVDDVAMALKTKQQRAKLMLCGGWDAVHLRMYDSLSAIMRGFEKNSHITLGGGLPRAILVSVLLQFTHWIPLVVALVAAFTGPAWLAVAGLAVHFLSGLEVLRRTRDKMAVNPLIVVPLFPVAVVVTAIILIRSSYLGNVKGVVNWRGRQLAKPEQSTQMFGNLSARTTAQAAQSTADSPSSADDSR